MCRFAKIKRVSRTVGKLYISTDVPKEDQLIDRVKKFVFGEGAAPEGMASMLGRCRKGSSTCK